MNIIRMCKYILKTACVPLITTDALTSHGTSSASFVYLYVEIGSGPIVPVEMGLAEPFSGKKKRDLV